MGKVDQQFEHLTDAQVEQYGEPGSVAGTDQERAPDWDSRDGDHKVEAHLNECPSCRTRVLASMRSRLALLTDAPLDAETSVNVDPSVHAAPRPDCPPEDDLRDLAAGLSPADRAAQLAQHAATCDHCGPILRMYTEDFADDLDESLTPDERKVLGKLKSSSSGWQKKLVGNFLSSSSAAASSPSSVPDRRPAFKQPWFRRLLIPATAAACATIAFFVWYPQRDTPEKAERLLAQAYTEQRTMEMRIPGAAHSDFKQKRSGETASVLSTPETLRTAASEIDSHLKKHPDDPTWLMLQARLDLLDWRYKPALSTLEKIGDTNASRSPEYLMLRALALYEKAEERKEKQAYFEAIDLLGSALQKTPNDTVLLFNRAILCEKVHAYECAKADWGHFLDQEKDVNWSAEAHEHLRQIEEKKTFDP